MAKKRSKSATESLPNQEVITCLAGYRKEADMACQERMQTNRTNWDMYHLRQDFSFKQKGQSREFLPKMSMATEQAANFLQQGLTDVGDWFRVDPEPGFTEDMLLIKPSEVRKLLERQLEKCNFLTQVGDMSKDGLCASLMIAKVHGKMVPRPQFRAKTSLKDGKFSTKLLKKEQYKWQLQIDLVSAENYRPDPSGRGLYEIEDTYMDYWELVKMAKDNPGVYDMKVIEQIQGSYESSGVNHAYFRAREQGLNTTVPQFRRVVKVTELWGNIISAQGDLLHENIVTTVVNDTWVVRAPEPNPLWHGESPYVACPILTVPRSPWGKALMDAPAMLNRAQNEMFNLTLDGGMMAVHGIKQIRKHWLDDEAQVEEGIAPGTTLAVNSACPPGASALERVDTATVPADGMEVLNLINQEFNAASMTNDLRMGVASFRSVKATEVVEASQTISSMFSGMAKQIEMKMITPILTKAWKTMLQHMDDLDSKDIEALISSKRAQALSQLAPEQIFAECVQGTVFKVFGISNVMSKMKEFTRLQALLQTVASSPVLMEAFSSKYGMPELLTEIMVSLDIDPDKLEPLIEAAQAGAPSVNQQPGQGPQGQGMQPQQQIPNAQSQISQAGAAAQSADNTAAQGVQPIQGTKFPASKATPAGSGTAQ